MGLQSFCSHDNVYCPGRAALGVTMIRATPRYMISQHPRVAARLEAELEAAGLLVTPARPSPRALEFADLAALTYLQAVIKARRVPYNTVCLPVGV